MSAIRIAAVADVWAKIAKKTSNLYGDHIPQLELANPGCIDNETAMAQREQTARGRCVPSFFVIGADLADRQVQNRAR